jgi:hypothetical protein
VFSNVADAELSIMRDSVTASPVTGNAALKIMWKDTQHAIRIIITPIDAQIDALTAWGPMQQIMLPALFGRQ